jgi:hypothetical protein
MIYNFSPNGYGPMTVDDKARNVSARNAVEAIRSPLTNAQILEQFKISPAGFGDLLRQLLAHKLITEEDLNRRGIRIKVVKKEAEMPAIATPSLLPPPPDEADEEFLDTVTLTELLTFKPGESGPPGKKDDEKRHVESSKVESEEDKKSKFSLGGLFKKGR